ncbi:MAG: hypothetical protein J6A05_06490 [Oscillospiraceae bacterium]|nr:hypothetical protein [Oscillospiraceae bacterium]
MELEIMDIYNALKEKFGEDFDEVMKEHPKLLRYHLRMAFAADEDESDSRIDNMIEMIINHIHSKYIPIEPVEKFPQVVFVLQNDLIGIYVDRIVTKDFKRKIYHPARMEEEVNKAIPFILGKALDPDLELRYLNAIVIDFTLKEERNKANSLADLEFFEIINRSFASVEVITPEKAFELWFDNATLVGRLSCGELQFVWRDMNVKLITFKEPSNSDFFVAHNIRKQSLHLVDKDICYGILCDYYKYF